MFFFQLEQFLTLNYEGFFTRTKNTLKNFRNMLRNPEFFWWNAIFFLIFLKVM